MGLLSQSQKDAFWKDGVLVVEDAVSDAQLEQLRTVFTGWVEESRSHTEDDADLSDDAFPPYHMRNTHIGHAPVFAQRLSFTGEMG